MGVWLLGATAASAAPADAVLRIGHLSPTTPAVDAYVTAEGAAASTRPVARSVSYGAVSPYLNLSPGRYTVDMRLAGTPASSPPAVTAAVDVTASSAQSLMFLNTGAGGAVQGQLLSDDRTAPASGTGLVRIIQAAEGVGPVEIQAVSGPRLASDLQYGTATSYTAAAAKSWDVAIVAGDKLQRATLDVTNGSITTVVITAKPDGDLGVTPVVDVAGDASALLPGARIPTGPPRVNESVVPATPRGGVGAGGGGTSGGPDPLPVLVTLGALVLAVGVVSETRLRRSRHRV